MTSKEEMMITDAMIEAGAKTANPLAWEMTDGRYIVSDITREETLDIVRRILTAALAATPAVGGLSSNIQRSLDTIENTYNDFPPPGPIKNCGEWNYLKRLIAATPVVGGEALADKLDAHAIRYANDYGYGIAVDLKEAAAALRALGGEEFFSKHHMMPDEMVALMMHWQARALKAESMPAVGGEDDPFNRRQVEAVCRAVCMVEGVDPDSDVYGDGYDPQWARYADAVAAALYAGQPASPLRGMEKLSRKRAVEFILEQDPFGDVFSRNELALIEGCPSDQRMPACTCPCSCDETPHDGKPCPLHSAVDDLRSAWDAAIGQPASQPAVGGEREALANAMAARSMNANRRFIFSFECADRDLIVAALRTAQPASPLRGMDSLETLIREYIRDLRRNSSGGDDYPWEYARGTADYLDVLIDRAASPPEQPAAAPVTGRETLEQIAIVCTDNMDSACNHRMALDFVRQIANNALKSTTAKETP